MPSPLDAPQPLRVGVVQAAPVFLDRDATTAKACRLIAEAGRQGVQVLGFPEGFIPTHPDWFHYVPASSRASFDFARRLFNEAVEVPGPVTEQIGAAAAAARTAVVVGVCERTPLPEQTLYNSQVFIGPDGRVLGTHRKIMPTLGERVVHARGSGDGLRVISTPAARLSGLICGENSNPLAIMALAADRPHVHVASWPSPVSRDEGGMTDLIRVASQSLAYASGAFVLSAQAVVDEAIAGELARTDADLAFLTGQIGRGSSMIVGPDRRVLAGPPDGPFEGILTADVDLQACVAARLVHDFAGHYNRADIFSLRVDRRTPDLVGSLEDTGGGIGRNGSGPIVADGPPGDPADPAGDPADPAGDPADPPRAASATDPGPELA